MKAELGEGLRYVFTHPYQRGMVGSGRALELLRQHRLLDPARLRGPRARPLRRRRSASCSRVGNLGTLAAALTARRISDRLGVGRTIVCRRVPVRSRHAPDRRWRRKDLAIPFLIASGMMRRLRRHPLQRHRDQPDPGDHARPDARTRERLAAVRRLGRDSGRRARRWRARRHDRAARDDVHRCARQPARRRADPALAVRSVGKMSELERSVRADRLREQRAGVALPGEVRLRAQPRERRRSPPPTPPRRRRAGRASPRAGRARPARRGPLRPP